jgi:nucleoside phosphorylase
MIDIADVLIVTATRIESKAVMEVFRSASGRAPQPVSIDDRMYHNLGTINGAKVFLVQSEMGAGGLGASSFTVQKGIAALAPAAVIMTGIAFGINADKQSIGDILVSRQLMLYDYQRISTAGKRKPKLIARGDRPHASSWLLDRFRSADMYWDETSVKVRFGLILSGEKLVDNISFRQQLHELEVEAIGGEMEGAGLYTACQEAKVDWIVVKSICDWADGNKIEKQEMHQQLAAKNAANFVLHVLQHAPLKREEKKRELAANSKTETKTAQVTILLDREFHEFTPDEQNSFIFALSRIVNVPPEQIQIIRVAQGSVLLTLEMSEESALVLLSMFLQKNPILYNLRISKVEITQTPDVPVLSVTSTGTAIDKTDQPVSRVTRSQIYSSESRNYERAVFVSYAWGGESERTVGELEKSFSKRGIKIVRDKKDLGYKGSIDEFEQRIGQGQCVVLVISDKYLRSEHCMNELVEVNNNRTLRERVFPIVLPDAHIYKAIDRLAYIRHWEMQIKELNQAIKEVDTLTNLDAITADLDKYARIRGSFDNLVDLLSDMNTLTPEIHAESDFSVLVDAVKQTISKSKP